MKALFLISILIPACVNRDAMTADAACEEQATTWCSAIGYVDSELCHESILNQCGPTRIRLVATADQDACLDAIAMITPSHVMPRACQITWEIVPPACDGVCF